MLTGLPWFEPSLVTFEMNHSILVTTNIIDDPTKYNSTIKFQGQGLNPWVKEWKTLSQ